MYDNINIQYIEYIEYSIYCILILSYVKVLFYDLIDKISNSCDKTQQTTR